MMKLYLKNGAKFLCKPYVNKFYLVFCISIDILTFFNILKIIYSKTKRDFIYEKILIYNIIYAVGYVF